MSKTKSLNKNQKIILTIWIILVAVIFICTLSPVHIVSGYGVEKSWIEPSMGEFAIGSLIVSIPLFVIYKIWGN